LQVAARETRTSPPRTGAVDALVTEAEKPTLVATGHGSWRARYGAGLVRRMHYSSSAQLSPAQPSPAQHEEDPLQTRSKLPFVACALATVLASCASRSREVAAPRTATASPASASAPGPRGSEAVDAPREVIRPRDADPAQMREHVARSLELVGALARERDRAGSRDAAAEALRAFADAIDVAPAPFDRDRVAALATSVRTEATRLARTDPISLQRSDLARAGLLAATGALEELSVRGSGAVLIRLLANADEAANAIDVSSPFVFERARIQDAFRATADAFFVFAERAREPAPTVGRR
jgi:hypothetical protein